jgi:hypothetical protein
MVGLYIFTLVYVLSVNFPVRICDTVLISVGGRDSVFGTGTCYELVGSRIESLCGRYFPCPTKPTPKPPHQFPVHWVPGLSRGETVRVGADYPPPFQHRDSEGLDRYLLSSSVLAQAFYGVTFTLRSQDGVVGIANR